MFFGACLYPKSYNHFLVWIPFKLQFYLLLHCTRRTGKVLFDCLRFVFCYCRRRRFCVLLPEVLQSHHRKSSSYSTTYNFFETLNSQLSQHQTLPIIFTLSTLTTSNITDHLHLPIITFTISLFSLLLFIK